MEAVALQEYCKRITMSVAGLHNRSQRLLLDSSFEFCIGYSLGENSPSLIIDQLNSNHIRLSEPWSHRLTECRKTVKQSVPSPHGEIIILSMTSTKDIESSLNLYVFSELVVPFQADQNHRHRNPPSRQIISRFIDIKLGPNGYSIIQPIDNFLIWLAGTFTNILRSSTST